MSELKPFAVAALENFDYDVRVLALRLLGCGDQISAALNDVLAHEKRREVVMCLAAMSWSGLLEYYRGDDELAGWCISREHALADDLANIEAQIETLGRTTPLRTKPDDSPPRPNLAAPVEARAWDGPPRLPKLPPGTVLSARGLALLRRRAAEE